MIQSIFYKELVKTKMSIWLSLVIFAILIIYIFINVQQMFRVSGATVVWTETIIKDASVLSNLKWIPLLLSVFFGISQFYSEMNSKRLKLTLHLPMTENKIMFSLISFGFIVLFALYSVSLLSIYVGLSIYFPAEIVYSAIISTLPWFFSGFVAYFFVAWICIEPVWRQRIFNVVISSIAISAFMLDTKSGAYNTFIPYLVVMLLLSCFFSYYSMYRFKDGAQ